VSWSSLEAFCWDAFCLVFVFQVKTFSGLRRGDDSGIDVVSFLGASLGKSWDMLRLWWFGLLGVGRFVAWSEILLEV
jgi:hypothetical protein